jgi:hypothetical protein
MENNEWFLKNYFLKEHLTIKVQIHIELLGKVQVSHKITALRGRVGPH